MKDGFWTGTVGGVVLGLLAFPEILRLEEISLADYAGGSNMPDHSFQNAGYCERPPALPGVHKALSIL